MSREKLLVVDDEEHILELLRYNLEKNGYQVETVDNGEDAVASARSNIPDLVLLDLMLPGIDGLEVCRILKNGHRTASIPILMLTAKGEDSDIVAGLELGADDYVTKPFSVNVLVARIRAVLRKKSAGESNQGGIIKVDDLVIDPSRHETIIKGKQIILTHSEFSILYLLAGNRGHVFTRHQIIDRIRGEEKAVTDRSVDVQIAGLRGKLGSYGKLIATVRGVGYKFKDE